MKRRTRALLSLAAAMIALSGCGSISVAPPPGLDPGGDNTPGDPGPRDLSGQDRPDWTEPDLGTDIPPVGCTTDDDCKAMPGLGPCIVGRCDLDTMTCWPVMLADGSECDDHDPCTLPDWCTKGECRGQPVVCDDGNPCTDDFCNEAGLCDVSPVTTSCDDGNACTVGDQCMNGHCFGSGVTCDDQDPCTLDECDPVSGCLFPIIPDCKPCENDSECDDGNPCTMNSCTNNRCGPTVNAQNGTPCDDLDPCSLSSQCQDGLCVALLTIVCNDNNPCTKDFCMGNGTCISQPISGVQCDDGNPCTLSDFCDKGTCLGGKPVNCDDLNPCTRDYCLVASALCPGSFSSPDPKYQCCHEPCSEPNPTCTSIGCRCGNIICDPATADRCSGGLLPGQYECKCGLLPACKPGQCCIKGQCQSGPCPVGTQ